MIGEKVVLVVDDDDDGRGDSADNYLVEGDHSLYPGLGRALSREEVEGEGIGRGGCRRDRRWSHPAA